MNLKFLVFLVLLTGPTLGQKNAAQFQHVEPPFWWVGMKTTSLQILFYNKDVNVSEYTASLDYAGVALKSVKKYPIHITCFSRSKFPQTLRPVTFP